MTTTRIGDGVYRVEQEGLAAIVYVAGTADDWWAFWKGEIFRSAPAIGRAQARSPARADAVLSLTAPMPATVTEVLVEPGAVVQRGATLLVLEAMKMQMPIRAAHEATVKAVHCRPGDIVQADAVLVDLA
jgi:3-methylcrotonyl-CoA carboxylase alpha subunit